MERRRRKAGKHRQKKGPASRRARTPKNHGQSKRSGRASRQRKGPARKGVRAKGLMTTKSWLNRGSHVIRGRCVPAGEADRSSKS